jgi:rfaE bifunctional protein kinase chain/domain
VENKRLEKILSSFPKVKIAVLGDFFLDLYISLERSLSELSLETNVEAFQAVDIKSLPGAAGVVTNNLIALGASTSAIAYTGDDGNGYVLRKELSQRGVNIEHLLQSTERFTPTYIKPMMTEEDGSTIELNRIDIKNRTPNPLELENEIIQRIRTAIQDHDGILVIEQVKDDSCGVLSPRVRTALAEVSLVNPKKVVMVDSRHFTAKYEHVSLKVNLSEAIKATGELDTQVHIQKNAGRLKTAKVCQRLLWKKVKRPIFITLGSKGISGCGNGEDFYHPGYQTSGSIDIVGAGDSVLAGCGISLCAGASPEEAAYIGNLIGSITIEQIGTTGITTPEQLLERHYEYQKQYHLIRA